MPDAVTIRRETEDDVEAVLDILEAVAAEGRWIGSELPFDRAARGAAHRDVRRDPATSVGFVAVVDGRVIGSIGLNRKPYGVVDLGMALLDGYRDRGIGRLLLDRGIEWARQAGAHKMALEVWPHNERAIALYRRAGFVETQGPKHSCRCDRTFALELH